MSLKPRNGDGKSSIDIKIMKRDLMNTLYQKLASHDWLELQRLKCNTYIDNNGVKNISVDEIVDFLLPDAINSFPKNVREEMADELKQYMDMLMFGP